LDTKLLILIVYAVVLLAISWWSTKLQKRGTSNRALQYLLAGRNLPTIIVAVLLCGLAVGGASTVGVAQSAYKNGFSAGWYNAAWGTGGIVVGLFFASHLRKMNVRTVPEMMGTMFGPKTRVLSVINQLIILMSVTSLQYVAGGAILSALLPDIFSTTGGMVASAVIFIAITVIGGYWASGISNLISVIVIYLGIIAALYQTMTNVQFGGYDAIMAALPALPEGRGWMDLVSGLGAAGVVGFVVVMTTQAITMQAVSQISFAARDERTARNGFLLGGALILPAGFLCAMFGIAAAAMAPDLPDAKLALPWIASQLTPFVGGIFLAALWAADVSTAVGLLMGSSMLVIEDVIKRIYTKKISSGGELFLSRATVLVVSLLSFLLALTVADILNTITSALAITTAFSLLVAASVYFPKLCRRGSGFPIILASLVLWIAWTFIPEIRVLPHLIYAEWLVCGAIFIVAAIVLKEPAGRLLSDAGVATNAETPDADAEVSVKGARS
jgi:SSS family solute:Na+ symporter